jgi:transcriptional regulator with XRE-family HTH domain
MRDETILQSFGHELRRIRQRKGISQEELAELAGLHRNYAGLLERGGSNPTLLALVALARALDVPPAKLIERIR